MSEIGTNTFAVNRRKRTYRDQPKRLKCFNCGNKVLAVVQTVRVFSYPPKDPRIARDGVDGELLRENWCLACIRAAPMEDDSGKCPVSINE